MPRKTTSPLLAGALALLVLNLAVPVTAAPAQTAGLCVPDDHEVGGSLLVGAGSTEEITVTESLYLPPIGMDSSTVQGLDAYIVDLGCDDLAPAFSVTARDATFPSLNDYELGLRFYNTAGQLLGQHLEGTQGDIFRADVPDDTRYVAVFALECTPGVYVLDPFVSEECLRFDVKVELS